MESHRYFDKNEIVAEANAIAEAESLNYALELIIARAKIQYWGALASIIFSILGLIWAGRNLALQGDFYTVTLMSEMIPALFILFSFIFFVSVRGLLISYGVIRSSIISANRLSKSVRDVVEFSESGSR